MPSNERAFLWDQFQQLITAMLIAGGIGLVVLGFAGRLRASEHKRSDARVETIELKSRRLTQFTYDVTTGKLISTGTEERSKNRPAQNVTVTIVVESPDGEQIYKHEFLEK